jgi:hypothetical protein
MEQISNFVEIIEHRQKARLARGAWFNIKMASERKNLIRVWTNLSKFQNIINGSTTQNVLQLKSDSDVLSNSKICKKIILAVLGKYQSALTKMQGNRLQCMMEERLSKETLSKLCERLCKMAEGSLRGLKYCTLEKLRKNHQLFERKKAVCKRVLDANFRLQASGWNTMMAFYNSHMAMVKDRMKFILGTLTNKDSAFLYAAYQGMVERKRMLDGVGSSKDERNKIQLIKRLTNQGYNMQVMACNCLQEFLTFERAREESEKLEQERQQKEKNRILRRIMDSNCRMMGVGFRQGWQFMETERERENLLIRRQTGVMKRMVDVNVRLMGAGWNKLLE